MMAAYRKMAFEHETASALTRASPSAPTPTPVLAPALAPALTLRYDLTTTANLVVIPGLMTSVRGFTMATDLTLPDMKPSYSTLFDPRTPVVVTSSHVTVRN